MRLIFGLLFSTMVFFQLGPSPNHITKATWQNQIEGLVDYLNNPANYDDLKNLFSTALSVCKITAFQVYSYSVHLS